jgi:hypothetical protein
MQGRTLAVGSLILAAAVAGSSDATATRPAISISSTPTVRTLETKVVTRFDARTHKLVPALRLGTATFSVVVANPSDVGLTAVTVVDPASPSCNRRIGTLDAGASFAYICHVPKVGRNLTIRVTASGHVPGDVRTLASASASATVTVKPPKRRRPHIPHFPPLATG